MLLTVQKKQDKSTNLLSFQQIHFFPIWTMSSLPLIIAAQGNTVTDHTDHDCRAMKVEQQALGGISLCVDCSIWGKKKKKSS